MSDLKELTKAAARGDVPRLLVLLRSGVNPNPTEEYPDRDAWPFLVVASESFGPINRQLTREDNFQDLVHGRGRYDNCEGFDSDRIERNRNALKILLQHGAVAFRRTSLSSLSTVHAAAMANNWNALKLILDKHPWAVDSGSEDNSPTPLMVAAKYGNLMAAKTLISAGADRRLVSHEGKTAFEIALEAGFPRTAKEMAYYDPERICVTPINASRFFAMLLWSAIDRDSVAFPQLLKYISGIRYVSPLQKDGLYELWRDKELTLRACFDYGLIYARLDIAKLAYEASETFDVNSSGPVYSTHPLHCASAAGNLEFAKFCLEIGADPFAVEMGKTAIDLAKQKGHPEIVALLSQAMRGQPKAAVKAFFKKLIGV